MLTAFPDIASSHDGPGAAGEALRRNRPDLDEASPTYRAAVVLLIAQTVGRGVHKLAKVTGFPSEFVARCARRLVDNGVWPEDQPYFNGSSIHDWEQFWLDVGVAEGKLCRRRDENGQLQWAPAGQWWKEYDFAVGSRNVSEGVVRYQPATVVPTTLLRDGMCDEDEVEVEEEEPPAKVLPAARRPLPLAASRSRSRSELVGVGNVVVLGGTELPDTCWLS